MLQAEAYMHSASIKNAAATIAHGLMSYYKNNQTDTAFKDVGTFPYMVCPRFLGYV